VAGRAAGLVVVGLDAGGLAERAGLIVGDLLIDASGSPLEQAEALRDALDNHAGGALRLTLLRGGALANVDVALG
jgi:S1-C subfamily serine protease